MTPLHLFRKDYISQNRQERSNWCTAEAWSEVKSAFAALDPPLRARYSKQCGFHREMAAHQKQLEDLRPDTDTGSGADIIALSGRPVQCVQSQSSQGQLQVPQPMVEGLEKPSPIFGNLLPAGFDELTKAFDSLEKLQPAVLMTMRQFPPEQEVHWPVQESNVLSALVSSRVNCGSLQVAVKEFSKALSNDSWS